MKIIKWIFGIVGLFTILLTIGSCAFTGVVVNEIDKELNATPAPVKNYSLGDMAVAGDTTLIVSKAEWSAYDEFYDPNEGCGVYGVYVTVTNNGNSEEYVYSGDFKLYANNMACSEYIWKDELPGSNLSPGRAVSGWLYFNVPLNATSIELEYVYDYRGSKVVFKLW